MAGKKKPSTWDALVEFATGKALKDAAAQGGKKKVKKVEKAKEKRRGTDYLKDRIKKTRYKRHDRDTD